MIISQETIIYRSQIITKNQKKICDLSGVRTHASVESAA